MKLERRLLIVNLVFVGLVSCAPKSDRFTTYDQKQTGDYNIQLHLKDFQIVALLGEDTLGAFGDYEYNYDYSDLTVKPHNTTTAKPIEQPSSSLSSEIPETTTHFATRPSSSTPVPSTTTVRIPETSSYSSAKTTQTSNTNSTSSKTVRSENMSSSTTEKLFGEKSQKVTSVTVLPAAAAVVTESSNNNSILNLGEILHYRRCPSGYSRDKRGRCRKTRRPGGIPYGITRLASNLAAQFRQAVSEEESSDGESSEK